MNKVLAISICLIFLTVAYYRFYVGRSERYNYDFHGKIQNISFDKKMIPTLIVSGRSYYLSPLRDFQVDVEVGDLAIKKRGEKTLKIIKQSNGKALKYKL